METPQSMGLFDCNNISFEGSTLLPEGKSSLIATSSKYPDKRTPSKAMHENYKRQ